MSRTTRYLAYLSAVVIAAMVSPGCGCGGDETNPTGSTSGPGGGGGQGGATSSSSGMGGQGGEGGGGGGAPSGAQATEIVSAGDVAESPNYKMVFTVGQPTQNQGTTTSPGYRMQGGLVGANGSLP